MNELLEAARAVIAWHERWPTSVPGQCPRMPDGKALACRCNTVCCHERLRMAIAVEDGKTYNWGDKTLWEPLYTSPPAHREIMRAALDALTGENIDNFEQYEAWNIRRVAVIAAIKESLK